MCWKLQLYNTNKSWRKRNVQYYNEMAQRYKIMWVEPQEATVEGQQNVFQTSSN